MAQAVEVAIRISLDRSGSRENGKEAVVPGLNTFLRKMQKDPSAPQTHLTIGMWDSQGFDLLRRGMMADIKLLENGEFKPRALTPLYDAVVNDIEALEQVQAKYRVLVIDTDGLENYSKRFTNPEAVKAIIEEKRRQGWVFIYLAANVDAWVQAKAFGIPESMAMNYRQAPAQRATLWQRMRGTAVEHPYATALLAIAGVALGVYALKSVFDAVFSDEVDRLGFTDDQRNSAMGVEAGWQEEVAKDVTTFVEPLPNVWALPDEVREAQRALPEDFEPAQGSMVDGVQVTADPDVDILAPEDVLTNLGGTVVDEADVEAITARGPETAEVVEGQREPLDLDLSPAPAPAPAPAERSFFRDPDPAPAPAPVERTFYSPPPAAPSAPVYVRDDPVERDTGGGGGGGGSDVAEVSTPDSDN